MFTDCLQTPSLNSHRKRQTAPPSKKQLSPICTKKRFQGPCFNTYLHHVYKYPLTYKDKKQPFYRAILDLFTFCLRPRCAIAHLIATGKAKVQALSKNISHLYEFLWGCWQPFLGEFQKIFLCSHLIGQKIGKIQPSRRRIYNLFTKFNSPPTYKDKNSAKYPLVKNISHLYP